jgi:hypothetical protein
MTNNDNLENVVSDNLSQAILLIFEKLSDPKKARLVKELQLKIADNKLISIKDASYLLGGLEKSRVKALYDKKKLKGISLNNGKIRLFYDSVIEYINSLKKIIQNDYFINEQNSMDRTQVTRTEYEKMSKKN